MGIKFLCPHGHKLNVKTFLAGKKGVCPECGERFVVPLESQPKQRVASIGVSSALQAGVQAAHEAVAGGMHDGHVVAARDDHEAVMAGHAAVAQLPVGQAAVAAGPPGHWGASPGGIPVAQASLPVGTPVGVAPQAYPAPAPAPTPAPLDPLSEAPQATWYVRPPSGGQFGPAKSDLLRRWITEGRVSADSLVWREDWPDWRTAGGLLPGVGEAPAPAPVKAPMPTTAPAYGAPAPSMLAGQPAGMAGPTAPMGGMIAGTAVGAPMGAPMGTPTAGSMIAGAAAPARPVVGRRPRSQYGLLIVIMLALIAILLLVALVYVIKSN